MDIIKLLGDFLEQHYLWAIAFAILAGMSFARLVPHQRRGDASPMTKKERAHLVKARLATRLTDAVEEAWLADEILIHEREEIYRKLGHLFKMKGELKPPPSKQAHKALKETIWERLSNWKLYNPVHFPDRQTSLREKLAKFYPSKNTAA